VSGVRTLTSSMPALRSLYGLFVEQLSAAEVTWLLSGSITS
jgi:hypothetical protein